MNVRPIITHDKYIVVDMDEGRFALRLAVEMIPISRLKGYVPEGAVDHTKVGVVTGKNSGLRGGGDATSFRELGLDIDNLPPVGEIDPKDSFPLRDGKTSVLKLNLVLDHDKLANMREAQHIDHSKVGIEPGTGLSGGGDATEVRVLRLALSSLETYVPARSACVPFVDLEKTHGKLSLEKLFELFRDWMKEEANAIQP